jgi:peroxiredoxin
MENVNRVRVGHFAPDFVLKDSEGRNFRLSDFREHKNVLLFFCVGERNPLCLDWLEELSFFCDEVERDDIQVLALSLDQKWTSRRLRRERKLRFPILTIKAEPGTSSNHPLVSQRYGVEIDPGGKESICPALFLVDKTGIVRYRKVYTEKTDRMDAEQLLCELGELV